jgi:hypothetical protein
MEYIEGPTLAERIHSGAIQQAEALPIAPQIAEVLEAAHEKGIVHRDRKPANVKVTPSGAVKVLDFRLAKRRASRPGSLPYRRGILGSRLIATAGGLIFCGDGWGAFVASDAKNGKPLWYFNTGQNWRAGLMTYMVAGTQCVSIAAGVHDPGFRFAIERSAECGKYSASQRPAALDGRGWSRSGADGESKRAAQIRIYDKNERCALLSRVAAVAAEGCCGEEQLQSGTDD